MLSSMSDVSSLNFYTSYHVDALRNIFNVIKVLVSSCNLTKSPQFLQECILDTKSTKPLRTTISDRNLFFCKKANKHKIIKGIFTVADLHSKIWTRALTPQPTPGCPNSFNFMQFLGKFGNIVC